MREDNDESGEVMGQLEALGYVDPGAGSSMWQIILAGYFGVSRRIKSALKPFLGQDGEEKD